MALLVKAGRVEKAQTPANIYLAVNVGWKLTYRLAFSRIAGLLKRGPFRPVVDEPGNNAMKRTFQPAFPLIRSLQAIGPFRHARLS